MVGLEVGRARGAPGLEQRGKWKRLRPGWRNPATAGPPRGPRNRVAWSMRAAPHGSPKPDDSHIGMS